MLTLFEGTHSVFCREKGSNHILGTTSRRTLVSSYGIDDPPWYWVYTGNLPSHLPNSILRRRSGQWLGASKKRSVPTNLRITFEYLIQVISWPTPWYSKLGLRRCCNTVAVIIQSSKERHHTPITSSKKGTQRRNICYLRCGLKSMNSTPKLQGHFLSKAPSTLFSRVDFNRNILMHNICTIGDGDYPLPCIILCLAAMFPVALNNDQSIVVCSEPPS